MAIDFNKFIPTATKTKTKLDFSKFLPKDYVAPTIKTNYLSSYLGGGAYLSAVGQPNKLIETTRDYAGVDTSPTSERHHIIPVEFGGSNETDKNILALNFDAHARITEAERQISNDYKNKKIDLPEARQKMMAVLQAELDAQKGIKQGTSANFLSGLKDTILHPIQTFKEAIKVNPQTEQTAKDIIENVKNVKSVDYGKTLNDFKNEIVNSGTNYFERLADVFEPSSSKSEVVGKVLKATARTAGLALSPISATFSASKNIPILGGIASAINLPLASIGDSLTNLTNLGLDALVATGKIKKDTAENIREGVNEVASLAGQMVVAGRIFKGEERAKAKEELTKKYSERDAETILTKAETRATIELQEKQAPKIDFNKFVPKKETNPLAQEATKYKSAEEFVRAQQPVYHGSPVPLKSFSNKKGGVFFTNEYFDATGFAGSPDNVYEGYLNFKKPLVIDAKGAKWNELNTKFGKSTQEVVSNAQKQGYDGVTFKNIVDNIGDTADWGGQSTIHYAFKPKDSFLNESQLTDIWNKANKEITTEGNKPAGLAKSIEAKAVEQGLIKDGFDKLASFETTTMKEQAKMASELINSDIKKTRRIIRGEEDLPQGLKGVSVIKAMEEAIKKNPDADLVYELANSPLASEVSKSAQELSLTRGRELDSATARLQEIKKARETKAGKDVAKKKEIKNNLKKETSKVNLTKEELSWDKFLNEIEC